MNISINASLKPSLPISPSNPSSLDSAHPPKPTLGPCSWRRRCLAGIACVIIGSTAGIRLEESGISLAGELNGVAAAAAGTTGARDGGEKGMRWSERRACPQWQANPLESIVPENLPRPSSRRRFESVSADRTAPAPAGISTQKYFALSSTGSCFSL